MAPGLVAVSERDLNNRPTSCECNVMILVVSSILKKGNEPKTSDIELDPSENTNMDIKDPIVS